MSAPTSERSVIIRECCLASLLMLAFMPLERAAAQARPAPGATTAKVIPTTAQPTVSAPSSQPTQSAPPIQTAPAIATPISTSPYSGSIDPGGSLGSLTSVDANSAGSTVTLVLPMVQAKPLYDARQQELKGNTNRFTLNVTVVDAGGGNSHTYHYGRCWMSQFDPASPGMVRAQVMYETVQVTMP